MALKLVKVLQLPAEPEPNTVYLLKKNGKIELHASTSDGTGLFGGYDPADYTYSHPSTHPASMIEQSSTARFVTDAEKTAWGAKLGDAPVDEKLYGRKNGNWVEVVASGGQSTTVLSYDNRNNLRGMSPSADQTAIVTDLGLFVWYSGSTEIDDDETCFATSSGRWLMQSAGLDGVRGIVLREIEEVVFPDVDKSISSALEEYKKVISVNFLMSITTLYTNTDASLTVSVPGAAPGDIVAITPASQLQRGTVIHGFVSSANVVTVVLGNLSGSQIDMASEYWNLAVIKK